MTVHVAQSTTETENSGSVEKCFKGYTSMSIENRPATKAKICKFQNKRKLNVSMKLVNAIYQYKSVSLLI